jgi:DNA-directed RNA polymerase alpha subunit
LTLKKKGRRSEREKTFDETSTVDLLNPDHVIAHLDAGGELDLEIEVSRGRGFVTAERLKREGQPVNTIPVDALFAPVSKVHYEVEYARVGQVTDYDKLILEVWTDGSISPADAVARAAEILRSSVTCFPVSRGAGVCVVEPQAPAPSGPGPGATGKLKDMVDQPVEMIELTVRASNCLKAAKIKTIGELISKTEEELMGFKNFGRKSLEEIKERLTEWACIWACWRRLPGRESEMNTHAGRKLSADGSAEVVVAELTVSLFRHEQIRTTVPKAKELSRFCRRCLGVGENQNLGKPSAGVGGNQRQRCSEEDLRRFGSALPNPVGWHARASTGSVPAMATTPKWP